MAIAAFPAPGPHSNEDAGSPSSRILAAISARDRLIQRQSMVMESAARVLGETSTENGVRLLMEATFKVADCERVCLFLKEDGGLVPYGYPFVEGCQRRAVGEGIAGTVASTGAAMNVADVTQFPELASLEAEGTCSVLAMPVHDDDGSVLAVMQATNKLGGGVFDAADERLLGLLLALTMHHVRLGELVAARIKADNRTETVLELVDKICNNSTLDEVVDALAVAAKDLIECQLVLVFLKEQDRFVCRAVPGQPLELAIGEPLTARVESGEAAIFWKEEHPQELQRLQELLGEALASSKTGLSERRMKRASTLEARKDRYSMVALNSLQLQLTWPSTAHSALCSPLVESGGPIFGVLIAVNRRADPYDEKGMSPNSTEGGSLGAMLRSSMAIRSEDLEATARHKDEPVTRFSEDDLDDLGLLLRLSAHFIQISKLYEAQRRTSRKQEALLSLISEVKTALAERDPRRFALQISAKSLVMFECDRCTFFTVDTLSDALVGYYRDENDELQELRLPIKGIAGTVATSNRLLNIRDAWSDERFSNATDLRTGYRTRTLLCAPLATSTGKVIAVLQCINKLRGEFFSDEDEKLLEMVSALLSDVLQRMMLEGGYAAFIHNNKYIDSDVKDMFSQYQVGRSKAPEPAEMTSEQKRNSVATKLSRSMTFMNTDITELTKQLRLWDFDICELTQDGALGCSKYIKACFQYFGLLLHFSIPNEPFASCIQAFKSRYSVTAKYHNYSHAVATLHAVFLLLDSEPFSGMLSDEDVLALLFAAIGHDVEHPGFTNAFLVNTRARLAIVYNDLAVLESHHSSVTNSILEGDGSLLSGIGSEERRRIRHVIVKSILGTDMAVHSECIKWLETESSAWDLPGLQEADDQLEGESAVKLASSLLHCADLVHPSLPWWIHKRRSLLIAAEFFNQFEEETRLGLPTMPFMGKDPTNLNGLGPIQVGFIQFVATPLWSGLNLAAGGDRLKSVLTNINTNRSVWKQLGDGEEVSDEQPFEVPPRSEERNFFFA